MPTYDTTIIARYLENDLSPEERSAFEASMQQDEQLANEVERYREAMALLQQRLPPDASADALRQSMKQLNEKYFIQKDKIAIVIKFLPQIVAIAAVLVIAVMVWWPRTDYLDKYGDTTMVATTERGDNNDTLMQKAADLFNKKAFKEALPLLDSVVSADSANQLARLYRGIARLHNNQLKEARTDLQIIYNGESVIRDEAALYIAISYAMEKNKDTAKEWLLKIPEGSPVSEKAAALLKKLD